MSNTVSFGLRGRKALVVGAGGIGEACVQQLLAEEAKLVLADVNEQRLAEVSQALDFPNAQALTMPCDIREPSACHRLVEHAADWLGGLDILIHLAGKNIRKPVLELEDYQWQDIMEVNLSSAFSLGQEAGRHMVKQRGGSIVFFSSVSGHLAHRHHAPYAASKGGLNQLMRVMAHEWADHSVTVNAIAPGYMATPLTNDYLSSNGMREKLTALVPFGRLGTPQDVVGPALFLCSDVARFITGQVLYVDGGRTLV